MILYSLIGWTLVMIGVISYGKTQEDYCSFRGTFPIFISVVMIYLGIIFLVEGRLIEKIAEIAKGVSMTDVPIKGEKIFTANVKISYKDGKLETVELIKNSTKLLQ